VLAVALALAADCAAEQSRGGKAVAESSNLDTEFATAVAQEGDAYRAARDAILERGEPALAFLELKQSSADWKTSLTASILAGWLKNRDLFDQCTAAILGHLFGPIPITGSFPANRRIAAVSRLGKAVTPRLLEMAMKTRERGDTEQTSAIFGSLVALDDPRAVGPLIEALKPSPDESLREWAASTLGPLQNIRAVTPLIAVLRTPAAPEMLRAAAAASLGTLGAREALPRLRAVAADVRANLGFRKAAVSAIGELGDADSAAGLLGTLASTHDLPFQLLVLITVGDIGAANVVPALRKIEHDHAEEPVRDAAKEARERIQERIGVEQD
jgi:HEAT repeat protein